MWLGHGFYTKGEVSERIQHETSILKHPCIIESIESMKAGRSKKIK